MTATEQNRDAQRAPGILGAIPEEPIFTSMDAGTDDRNDPSTRRSPRNFEPWICSPSISVFSVS
jgi:hypothetical protein